MKSLLLGLSLALHAVTAPALAAPELPVQAKYAPSADGLTTEKAWVLDATEPNPHRQRWVLNRKVELQGLKPREISKAGAAASYGVQAEGLVSLSTGYLRPDGPWYRPLADFPCASEGPLSWFATREGTALAAEASAREWGQAVTEGRLKLALLLSRVTAPTPGTAIRKAELIYQAWLDGITEDWKVRGRPKAKLEEWRHYRELAGKAGVCGGAKAAAKGKPAPAVYEDEHVPSSRGVAVPWELMMEPPAQGDAGRAGTPRDELKLLARAPSRRWDGLYSIRVNLTVAGRKLSGRFLVDSGVGTSVISPDWLESQGILPVWIEAPLPPRRVPWGGAPGSSGGLAPMAVVDAVEIGNFRISLNEFALFDTEFFAPPEAASSCCDGVLGTDFLRKYVVEFQPGPPAEVKVWPREGFHLADAASAAEKSQWLEAGLTPSGDVISSCVARIDRSADRGSRSRPLKLVGVRWDTGREGALDVHVPWQKEARAAVSQARGNQWEISCGPAPAEPVARSVPATFPELDPYENRAIQSKVPAFSVGTALLGKGRFYLDLPHGRIWVPAKTSSEPVRRNRSGLALRYGFVKGKGEARELRVSSIQPTSPAGALVSRGLRAGMVITQIDSLDPATLDSWEIEQRLSGAYGESVTLQFKTPKGLRLGRVKVR